MRAAVRRALVVYALVMAPWACVKSTPAPPPEPDVVVFPGLFEAGEPPTCAGACARLRVARCPEGFGFDGGDSCEVVCQHVVDTALTPLDPGCIARATNDDELHACHVRCPR